MSKKLTAIDLFAGIGGFSQGATAAGVDVLFAANHWPKAVEFHQLNHPETIHACQDLRQIDWNQVPDHDILLASPCCQGHSSARGRDDLKADISRQTAWCVIEGLSYKRPPYFVVENVYEFLGWELFPFWKGAIEHLGYKITVNKLNSADFGVPQSRRRIFIVGSLEKEIEIKAPEITPKNAIDIIDWSAGKWRPLSIYGKVIQRQVDNARKSFGDRFLLKYYSSERNGHSLHKPFGALTTNDHNLIVDGDMARSLTVDEYRAAMGFPEEYKLPAETTHAKKMLGNAVCPNVVQEVISQIVLAHENSK